MISGSTKVKPLPAVGVTLLRTCRQVYDEARNVARTWPVTFVTRANTILGDLLSLGVCPPNDTCAGIHVLSLPCDSKGHVRRAKSMAFPPVSFQNVHFRSHITVLRLRLRIRCFRQPGAHVFGPLGGFEKYETDVAELLKAAFPALESLQLELGGQIRDPTTMEELVRVSKCVPKQIRIDVLPRVCRHTFSLAALLDSSLRHRHTTPQTKNYGAAIQQSFLFRQVRGPL